MKSILLTKTFWFNTVMTVIDVAALLQTVFPNNPKLAIIAVLVHGIGNIVLRRFSSTTPAGFNLVGVIPGK